MEYFKINGSSGSLDMYNTLKSSQQAEPACYLSQSSIKSTFKL